MTRQTMADRSSSDVASQPPASTRRSLRLARAQPEVWELGLVALAEVIRADNVALSFRAKYSESSGRSVPPEGCQAS